MGGMTSEGEGVANQGVYRLLGVGKLRWYNWGC